MKDGEPRPGTHRAPAYTGTEAQSFGHHARYVAHLGLCLLGNETEAEELVKHVFIDAWRRREQLRAPSAKAWLATLAVRVARRLLRRRRLRQFFGCDHRKQALERPRSCLSPEERALLGRVYEILDKLPIEQRLAWILRHVEGEQLRQVAERCECSVARVKRRVLAAHTQMLVELDEE